MVGPGRQLVLTGAPGGGKTTLLDAAERVGLSVSHEVARAILRQPGGMALRVRDPLGFAEAMAAAHLREKARFAGHAAPVIFDRGLPDVVGFLKVSGLPVPPAIDRACGEVRYSGPILRAPAWRAIYRQDAQRIQSWDEAVASDAAVTQAWEHYGYAVTILPFEPVTERLAVLQRLASL